jgi:hypothetical protein
MYSVAIQEIPEYAVGTAILHRCLALLVRSTSLQTVRTISPGQSNQAVQVCSLSQHTRWLEERLGAYDAHVKVLSGTQVRLIDPELLRISHDTSHDVQVDCNVGQIQSLS